MNRRHCIHDEDNVTHHVSDGVCPEWYSDFMMSLPFLGFLIGLFLCELFS